LIPLLVVCSSGLFAVSKLLFWIGTEIPKLVPLPFTLPADSILAKFENVEIGLWEFGFAILLAFLAPVLAAKIRGRRIDLFLNPFGQFRSESAIVEAITALMSAKSPMMLVLDDKRVYIGVPLRADSRSGDLGSISLIPWMSGRNDGKLRITTNYLEEKNGELGVAQFAVEHPITILLKRSVSLRGFNIEVFLDYFDKGNIEVENKDLEAYFRRMIDAIKKTRAAELICVERN
jgi:hypothetical protein